MTKHHLVENRASRLTDEAEQGDGKKKKERESGGGERFSKGAAEPPRCGRRAIRVNVRIIETCLIGMSSG
jgi:hypothetical protein